MKKGVICDLDGTLVSTISLHESAWCELFRRYNIELTDTELLEQSGKKNTLFIRMVSERTGISFDAEKLSQEKDMLVIQALSQNPPAIFAGVQELLTLLKEKGIKLALATSATEQTARLLGKELFHYFDAHVFAEDVQHGKPHPEIFLKAAGKLGLSPQECAVFEDATSGVEAAKAGGFFCVARDNHLRQNISEADLIVEEYNAKELVNLLCS